MGNLDSQDSPRPRLGGSHHLPPYSIICACQWDWHSNGILFRDSQVGVSKFSELGLLQLWGRITFCANLRLKCNLKQSCNPRRGLSNSMLYTTCTQGNRGDSWLLVIGSQIANLISDLSFDHNLCFRFQMGHVSPF
jgi:hypothetical protein